MDGDNSNDAAYHHGSGGGHSGSGGHSEASFRSNTLAIPKSVFSAFNDDSTGGEKVYPLVKENVMETYTIF